MLETIDRFSNEELNEIETLKNRIENIIREQKIDKRFGYRFEVIEDGYLCFDFITGCIAMRLDRAEAADMRLFVIQDFINYYPFAPSCFEGEDLIGELYFYTCMPEAIEKILSLLDHHIKVYLSEYS